MSEIDVAIWKATEATLRKAAEWGIYCTPEVLREVAAEVALGPDWDCCPVCEEMDCDEDCPLAPVRADPNGEKA